MSPHEFQAQCSSAAWRSCSPSARSDAAGFSTIGTGPPDDHLRLHALMLVGGAPAALSAAHRQSCPKRHGAVSSPSPSARFSPRLAQAGLWTIVYVMTGLALDSPRGRPPTFTPPTIMRAPDSSKARYTGAVFMFLLLVIALPLRDPRLCRVRADLRASALSRCWSCLSVDPDDRRQRRRHAAVLWPPRQKLSRSAPIARGIGRRDRAAPGR